MLNRQQSKKRNSWKYVLVLPALAAFMLAFQVKTVAQQKEAPVQQAEPKSKLVIEITKDTKDEELEADKKTFKQEYNANVNFENIKRNQNKEITAIKVTVEDNGQSQMYEVAGNSPIAPFTIEIEKDRSGSNNINFGTGRNGNRIMAHAFTIDNDTIVMKGKGTVRLGRLDESTIPMAPPAPDFNSPGAVKIDSDDFLVVIDGVKKGKGETALKGLRSDEIASINILKNKEARKKYGRDAKKGVIEITTRKRGRAPRMMYMEPGRHFEFSMPDLPNMPDMPNMERFEFSFGDMGDMEDFFYDEDGDVKIYRRHLSDEELKKLQKQTEELQKQMFKRFEDKDYDEMWQWLKEEPGTENAEVIKELKESRDKSRKEIEEARKELEKARKEIEEARKELEKTRQQFNKKA